MKPKLTPYLGQRVTVTIDRPLGSVHPRFPASKPYPVNYGFLPETLSGDGHPIDAYLLGPDEPVESAQGTVIAMVLRADDAEDKLVVATEPYSLTPEEVASAIEFQERYFNSTLIMEGVQGYSPARGLGVSPNSPLPLNQEGVQGYSPARGLGVSPNSPLPLKS